MSTVGSKSKVYCRLVNIVSLCLWIFDHTSDIFTVTLYWNEQPHAIVVVSTTVLVISSSISLALVPGLLYLIWTGKEHTVKWTCYLKYAVAMFGSIPQLCINIIVLSICGQVIHPIQYISAAASLAEICSGIVCGDQAFGDQSNEQRSWADRVSLFLAKVLACTSRIIIGTLFILYEGWWSLFIVLAHTLILIPLGVLKVRKEWRQNEKFVNFLTLSKLIFFGIGFMFFWFGDTWNKQLTIAWALLYFLQTFVLLFPMYAKLYVNPTCLPFLFYWIAGIITFSGIFASVNVVVARHYRKALKFQEIEMRNLATLKEEDET